MEIFILFMVMKRFLRSISKLNQAPGPRFMISREFCVI